jgi:DNA-binding NarL/FixJ family response regulator
MAFSSIFFVSNNANKFQHIITKLVDDNSIQLVNDLDVHLDKQHRYDGTALTIIDSELIQQSDAISLITEKIVGKIIVIGRDWPEHRQIEAIALGISGYCDQNINALLFCDVVTSVHSGEVWIPRHLIPKVINLLIAKNINPLSTVADAKLITKNREKLASLSDREKQVSLMIAVGSGNKQIAKNMFITERTVKAHLSKIFQKLNVPDRINLAIFMKNLDQ